MMYEIAAEITVAILAFVGTLAGSIMVSQKTTWRLDQLEAKMEKHNQMIERMYHLEFEHEETKAEVERLREKMERIGEA